jgi:3-hydroxyisobutyrate dehydrogenase-like beta-hydroxyacid dehydrogenase
MQVAVIGVGAMGTAMAAHIVKAGHSVLAHDVDAARRDAAADIGARPVAAIGDLAGAEVFIVVVNTDEQSRQVTRALLDGGARPGAVIAIAATNHPMTMRELGAECAARDVGFIDAPVVFGLQGARTGDLGTLCGGSAADVARARPALEPYSRFVRHVGPLGAGQLAKTCNNMLHWAACCANYEVLLLAKRYGIDAQYMREILLDCPGSNVTLERWDGTRFIWHEKDMDVALDLAQTASLPLPLFGQVDQLVKTLGPDKVKALLYGAEAEYLGVTVTPLSAAEGGLADIKTVTD